MVAEKDDATLANIYYDPKHYASFSGRNNLYRAVKGKISKDDVDDWLLKQDTYTLHRPRRNKFERRRIRTSSVDELWQADLCSMGMLATYNDGVSYLLCVIDTLSKYAWVVCLKSKTANVVKHGFQSIFDSTTRRPNAIQTDKGGEFVNAIVKNYLKDKGIHFYTSQNEPHAAMVERFQRTLKERLYRYMTRKNTREYVDVLQKIVSAYNDTKHTSTGMVPSEVNRSNELVAWRNIKKNYKPSTRRNDRRRGVKVGDHVRISQEKMPFEKAYRGLWSREIFTISQILSDRSPVLYKLNDYSGEPLTGTFYRDEIQPIKGVMPDRAYEIEHVFKSRKVRGSKTGEREYFVKWLGYPKKFNSWVRNPWDI